MPRSLKTDEIERICQNVRTILDTGTLTARRDACGVLLGLSGLRIQEVCNANRNDLRQDTDGQHWLKIRTLKGGVKREIPIETNLVAQLRALRHRGPSAPLLQAENGSRVDQRNLRRSWQRIRTEAQVAPARFHDLRRTCATQAWESSGKNLFVVQTLLGHRRLENTRIYLVDTGDIQKAVITFGLSLPRSALQG